MSEPTKPQTRSPEDPRDRGELAQEMSEAAVKELVSVPISDAATGALLGVFGELSGAIVGHTLGGVAGAAAGVIIKRLLGATALTTRQLNILLDEPFDTAIAILREVELTTVQTDAEYREWVRQLRLCFDNLRRAYSHASKGNKAACAIIRLHQCVVAALIPGGGPFAELYLSELMQPVQQLRNAAEEAERKANEHPIERLEDELRDLEGWQDMAPAPGPDPDWEIEQRDLAMARKEAEILALIERTRSFLQDATQLRREASDLENHSIRIRALVEKTSAEAIKYNFRA